MELGNMVFGHSRGAWQVPRNAAYEGPLDVLFEAAGLSSYGYPNDPDADYFDNDVWSARSYWWGDEEAPEADLPNFIHKPSGLELRWYKYPMRDSYFNREISPLEWFNIIQECVTSLQKGE
jgi:hypothetical protein